MRPFNLKEALAGKPVVTRGGRKVKALHHFDCVKGKESLMVVIEADPRDATVRAYFEDGRYLGSGNKSQSDLMMAPIMRYSVMVLKDHRPYAVTTFENEEEANRDLASRKANDNTMYPPICVLPYEV